MRAGRTTSVSGQHLFKSHLPSSGMSNQTETLFLPEPHKRSSLSGTWVPARAARSFTSRIRSSRIRSSRASPRLSVPPSILTSCSLSSASACSSYSSTITEGPAYIRLSLLLQLPAWTSRTSTLYVFDRETIAQCTLIHPAALLPDSTHRNCRPHASPVISTTLLRSCLCSRQLRARLARAFPGFVHDVGTLE